MSFLAATNIDVLNFTSFSLMGLRVGRAAATPSQSECPRFVPRPRCASADFQPSAKPNERLSRVWPRRDQSDGNSRRESRLNDASLRSSHELSSGMIEDVKAR